MAALSSWQQQVREWFAGPVRSGLAVFARELAAAQGPGARTVGGCIEVGRRAENWGAASPRIDVSAYISNGEGAPWPRPPQEGGDPSPFSPQSLWEFEITVNVQGQTDDDGPAELAEAALERILRAVEDLARSKPPGAVGMHLLGVGANTDRRGEDDRAAIFGVVKSRPY